MQIGFMGALTLLFITLKLLGVIAWSWWLVTLPLWGGLALILSVFVLIPAIALGVAFMLDLVKSLTKTTRK